VSNTASDSLNQAQPLCADSVLQQVDLLRQRLRLAADYQLRTLELHLALERRIVASALRLVSHRFCIFFWRMQSLQFSPSFVGLHE